MQRDEQDTFRGGLNKSRDETIIPPGQTPACINVEFNRDSCQSTRGIEKLGNRAAPTTGVRTKAPDSLPPLRIGASSSVPLRGYVYHPYSARLDIAGDGVSDGAAPGVALYHARRGKSFEVTTKFRLPADGETLYVRNGDLSGPFNYDSLSAPNQALVDEIEAGAGYNEALEECTLIVQQGGDRTMPLVWAIGITNVADKAALVDANATAQKGGHWRVVFMWYDQAEMAQNGGARMRYELADTGDASVGEYATDALRAIVLDAPVEPGRDYSVSVGVQLDSGTAFLAGTAAAPEVAWNNDGWVQMALIDEDGQEEYVGLFSNTGLPRAPIWTADGILDWKGPADSLEYLSKYGIRFTSSFPIFTGLGYRMLPWDDLGFIPFGSDSSKLEFGGFSLTDYSKRSAPTGYTIQTTHVLADSFVTFDAANITTGKVAAGGQSPLIPGVVWAGASQNPDALRNYWCALYGDTADPVLDGARFLLGTQNTTTDFEAGLSATAPAWSNRDTAIYPFRWRQRDLVVGETRLYSAPVAYTGNDRAIHTLRTQSLSTDRDEPNRENLLARWPMNDSGGGVVHETVGGNDAFLAPFGLGQSARGTRGKTLTFLSGEGEAIKLDFESNPVLRREMLHALRDGQSGFAIEITCELPEPYYGIPELQGSGTHGLTGNVYVGRHAPIIASWEAKGSDSGLEVDPKPLIQLTHRGVWGDSATTGFRAPMGFTLLAALASDQEDEELTCIVPQWKDTAAGGPTATQGFLWGRDAAWVGQSITIQFGVHPTGNADEFVCYVSAIPRGAFPVSSTDDLDGEMAWFGAIDADTQANQARTISKKDLVRSVITIGGGWAPGSLGYSELNCRMLVDEVRVFGTAAPGALPATNGGVVVFGTGKIAGRRAYPQAELTIDDIVQPLGNGIETANVVDHQSVVSAPSGRLFYEAEPQDTLKAIERTFLIVAGDTYESYGDLGELKEQEEFYFVDTVTPGGASLVLKGSFEGADRKNALAGSFRLIGYAAFADNISSKALSLGAGASYTPGTTTVDDVIETEPYFTNRAPVSGDWTLRIYSPASGEPITRYTPSWTRGVGETRRNRILGMASKFGDLYAAVQGAVYEVDDRWRDEGPTDDIPQSLEFRGAKTASGTSIPAAFDQVEFLWSDLATGGADAAPPGAGTCARRWDFWVNVDEFATYQTLLWVGNPDTPPDELAGDGAGQHAMRFWFRLANGRPEWCVGSTRTTDGTTRPPRGFFVARGQGVIPTGADVHIRFEVEEVDDASDYWRLPKIAINGKHVPVTVNAVDNSGVAGAWFRTTGMVGLTDSVYALGAAHDAYSQPREDLAFVEGSVRGVELASNTLHGWIHGLMGRLSGVTQSSKASSPVGVNFDPQTLDYSADSVRLAAINGGDMGHKCWSGTVDSGGAGIFGVVKSHPCLSRFHELGRFDANVSFADYEQKLYATNGGRPASINLDPARFMGLLAPTTAPKNDLQRFPLWEENVRDADNGSNDPQPVAAAGADERQLHFSSFGNNYLRIPFSREMRFETDGTNFDLFAFKCLVSPRKTSGRIPLYSTRAGRDSGNVFVEIRDGELWVGWYDTFLKKEQAVRTSGQVIYPGYWHYIYVRKTFPKQDGWTGSFASGTPYDGDSNWNNSVFELTKTQAFDSIVVRRFHRGDPASAPFEDGLWARDSATTRACVSFTVDDDMTRPAGTTATGLVSNAAITYTGGVSGAITGSAAVFHEDMVGFYFQFGDGPEAGRLFRIAGYTSSTQIDVVDAQSGAVPDLSAVTAGKLGGVFTGVALVKTEEFDQSTEPDATAHDIDLFGSSEAVDPLAGLAPFDGKFDSFALFTASTATGQNVDIFETARTDEIETGTDLFPINRLDNPGGATPNGIGALRCDSGKTWLSVLTDTYAGAPTRVWPQPNEDLELARSAASVNSEPPQWRYLQGPVLLEGTRRVRVAFFDRDRNIWSNPSPSLTVQPPSEERSNPSGQMRYLLSGLPTSRDKGNIERWVYMTLANGAQYFLVARVPDNTSTAVAVDKTENEILAGDVLRFDNPAPPACAVIASSGPTMFFGALTAQSDLVMFSKPFFPESVPAANLLPLVTGGSEPVVAMRDIRGQLAVLKARSLWRVRIVGGIATREFIARVGCLSPTSIGDLDDRIFFTDGRGVYVYTGSGQPVWVGHVMESFFEEEVDRRRMWRCAAAVNRARNQFILTTPLESDDAPRHRISCEFDHAYSGVAGGTKQPALYRFSQYEDPSLTALCSLPDESGGVDSLMGGTEDGFLVRLDSAATQKCMIGEDEGGFGDVEFLAAVDCTQAVVYSKTAIAIDEAFGGARGASIRWEAADGTQHQSTILFADTVTNAFHLDRRMEPPPDGTRVVIGSPRRSWETPWRSFGMPERNKRPLYVDVTYGEGATGRLLIECMAIEDQTKVVSKTVVLDGATLFRVDIGALRGHQIKVRMRSAPGYAAEKFELTRMTVRLSDSDQKKIRAVK